MKKRQLERKGQRRRFLFPHKTKVPRKKKKASIEKSVRKAAGDSLRSAKSKLSSESSKRERGEREREREERMRGGRRCTVTGLKDARQLPRFRAPTHAHQFQIDIEREKRASKTGLPVWMLGMGAGQWEDDMSHLLALLFHQGVLDEHFMQLQQLQDESSPNFVSEVISIYFRESEKLLRNIRSLLADRECTDYRKICVYLNHLTGSSSSIGANLVRNVCIAFRAASEHCNWVGCLRSLAVLEREYCYLKNKLHELFQIEQHRVLAEGVRYHPDLLQ